MKRFLAFAAVTLLLASALPDEASAQRRGFGGGPGMRIGGAGFGSGGLRVGGAGFGTAGLGAVGRPGLGWGAVGRPGLGWGAVGRPGLGWGGAWRPGWRPGWGVAGGWWGPGWRRAGWGWGWGLPLAVGVGLGYASYADSGCLAWDGYRWVNICYPSYSYSYW